MTGRGARKEKGPVGEAYGRCNVLLSFEQLK